MVLLGFDLLGRANDKAGLIRVNGKAWAHRDDFQPIRDRNQWGLLLEQWETGLCRSLEFVIEDDVPLDRSWKVVAYPVAAESLLADWMRGSVDQNNEWQPIRLPRNRRSGLGCTSRIPSGYAWFERCSGPTRSSPAVLGAPESGQPGDHNATVPLPIGPRP